MSTFFEFLPFGAYQANPQGLLTRANPALVRLNGYENEAEFIRDENSGIPWYVQDERRQQFWHVLRTELFIHDFISEVFRLKTRERAWVRETAHAVRNEQGEILYFEGTVEDITAHRKAQLMVDEASSRMRLALECTGDDVWEWQIQAGLEFYSESYKKKCGYDSAQSWFPTHEHEMRVHPADYDQWIKSQQDHLDGLVPRYHNEHRERLADGSWRWVRSRGMIISWDEQGRPLRMIGTQSDIHDHKMAEAELKRAEELWKLALESTGDGVWDWQITQKKSYFSDRCKEIFGYVLAAGADLQNPFMDLTHPDDVEKTLHDLDQHLSGRLPHFRNELRILCSDGSWKWVLARGMVISRDEHAAAVRMIGTFTDISDMKNAEELIWQQANFDPLTGLPNRRKLHRKLQKDIQRCQQEGKSLAVLFIDLDHFKEVNDTLGHNCGDRLLIEASNRIKLCLGTDDTLARMGGDEFTAVIFDVSERTRLYEVIGKILEGMASVFVLDSENIFISASVGVAVCPDNAQQIDGLFRYADQALYVAKSAGRNQVSFFSAELEVAAQARLRMIADLRHALERDEFVMVYQPIVHLGSGVTHKAEALIRWHHPTRGLVNPTEFIPIAEATGLILEIGEWVFQQAARQVQLWQKIFGLDFQISVNKSPIQFRPELNDQSNWAEQLRSMGIAGNSIAVEITEGVLLDDGSSVHKHLQTLRDGGLCVSLDDFGTGYSSMTYLQRYAIDYIKIDQSFVRNIKAGSTDLAVCKAIIVMAHELGLKVIAEGVESLAQAEILKQIGCDYGQGYYFSRPANPENFEVFMLQSRARLEPAR